MLLKTIAGLSLLVSCVLFACVDWALWTLPLLFIGIYGLLFLLAVAFLWAICAVVNLDKPQEEDSPFYLSLIHI